MGGVFLIIQMEMFIKENLKKILQMVMENIIMRMVLYIMGIGQMILSLGQDMKYGMTLQIIMEIIKMVKKMEQEHIYGQIINSLLAFGKMENRMELENLLKEKVLNMVNGKKVKRKKISVMKINSLIALRMRMKNIQHCSNGILIKLKYFWKQIDF